VETRAKQLNGLCLLTDTTDLEESNPVAAGVMKAVGVEGARQEVAGSDGGRDREGDQSRRQGREQPG
jgi:hypothetical protein